MVNKKIFISIIFFIFIVFIYYFSDFKEIIINYNDLELTESIDGVVVGGDLVKNRYFLNRGFADYRFYYYPVIDYCYYVNDIKYCSSDNVDVNLKKLSIDEVDNKLEDYLINSDVIVYFDKNNPSNSCLEKSTQSFHSFVFWRIARLSKSLIFLLLIVLTIFTTAYFLQNKKIHKA